jgi:hypothetical protein
VYTLCWNANCIQQSASYKLTLPHLVKKFPAFYVTRRFITIHYSAPIVPNMSQLNQVQSSSVFLKTHFNNILPPPMPRSYKLTLSFGFLHQNRLCISLLPQLATCPAHLTNSWVQITMRLYVFSSTPLLPRPS